MRGAEGVPVHQLQEDSRGSVSGQRVRGWMEDIEMIGAVGPSAELAAQVVGFLVVWVLEVVLAVRGGLPDVEDGVGDASFCNCVGDPAPHQGDPAIVRAADDAIAQFAEGGVRAPEGPEDRGRGGYVIARF